MSTARTPVTRSARRILIGRRRAPSEPGARLVAAPPDRWGALLRRAWRFSCGLARVACSNLTERCAARKRGLAQAGTSRSRASAAFVQGPPPRQRGLCPHGASTQARGRTWAKSSLPLTSTSCCIAPNIARLILIFPSTGAYRGSLRTRIPRLALSIAAACSLLQQSQPRRPP